MNHLALKSNTNRLLGALVLLASTSACSSSKSTQDAAAITERDVVNARLADLRAGAVELQAAAPASDDNGWNATDDAAAVDAMKAALKKMRAAYESIESAVAPIFPDADTSLDARYEDFLADGPDDNLFDGEGVTGMHAVERILYSNTIPTNVVTFESGLTGYVAAAFPANADEARAFKEELCARMVTDVDDVIAAFPAKPLTPEVGYGGLIDSMKEQFEKVNNAFTGSEESRYSQATLEDMRNNVSGAQTSYASYRPWLLEQADGTAIDQAVTAAFQRTLDTLNALPGDSLPAVPGTWSASNPSVNDLATPYGQLFQFFQTETDPTAPSSLVGSLSRGATALGVPLAP